MGRKGWPSELSGESLVAAVRAHLHAPAARAHARHLSHSPAMLDELVSLGRYLGIDAQQVLLTSCYLLLATYYLLLATCYLLLTSRPLEIASSFPPRHPRDPQITLP